MRTIFYIFMAGSAFGLSAFDAIAPPGGDTGRTSGFRDSSGFRGGYSPASGPFSLRYQYSSFADDTALYSAAYKIAGTLPGVGNKAGGTGDRVSGSGGHQGTIMAGTISHHLFIRDLIAQYFTQLARCVHPTTIIIIGPNHHARGHSPVALSALRWRTPFGFVEPDTEAIRTISETGLACVDEEAFVNEHSIGALVPFIRKSFPGSRIVPMIFKKSANREDCVKLGVILSRLMENTVLLASLDFSHYRTSREAEKEDAASLDVLRLLSLERIDEAFVDSRPAMLTLLSLCRSAGTDRIEVAQHTNSGIISHNPRVPCTSYINSYVWREQ